MALWSNGAETIQVPDGIPAGHLAVLGWNLVAGQDTAPAKATRQATKRPSAVKPADEDE